MQISKEELRKISISTWPRVKMAAAICVTSTGATLLIWLFSTELPHFTTMPIALLTFAYAGTSIIVTTHYKLTAGDGPHWNALTDTPDFFRRLIVREEIK